MNQQVCIIIHGFTGNPWEVEPLANALESTGYKVLTPLLPGHNREKVRMEKTTALDWIRMIEEILEKAINEDQEIHMIGFSMGAMIASLMAYRYPISSLVLLSPSVFVLTPYVLKMKIKTFLELYRENRTLLGSTVLSNLSSMSSTPLSNVFEFHKIVRQAKTVFQHITIPICIIHGQKDELVDPKSSEWIYRVVHSKEKELHFLPHSKHIICQDYELTTVIQTVTNFLKKVNKKRNRYH